MAGAELGDLRDLVSPSLTVHPVFLFGVRRVLSKGEMRRTATLMITTSCMGMSKRA
jgi:hypothetical protein